MISRRRLSRSSLTIFGVCEEAQKEVELGCFHFLVLACLKNKHLQSPDKHHMTTIRYCPCCKKKGLNAYTKWNLRSPGSTVMVCETSHQPWHHTYIHNGVYRFSNDHGLVDGCTCLGSSVDDNGAWCGCGESPRYKLQYAFLKSALYADVESGINFEMWALTFPRRVAEVMERYKAVAAAALADKLPTVLIEIIGSYQ
jgi:hypothetical protein